MNWRNVMDKTQWFVMRAYKQESKAEMLLAAAEGIDCFVPKHYALRTYQGKTSRRLVPLIPSLIFVHSSKEKIASFKRKHDFLQYVMWKKRSGMTEYMIVADKEMEDFIRVSTCYEEPLAYYKPDELPLERGARVRICGGRLEGVEGTFLKVKGARSRRLVVLLKGVLAVAVEVSPDQVEVLG